MRRLSRGRLARRLRIFYSYQSYVHGNILGGVVVTLLILVPVHAAYMFLAAPGILAGGGQAGVILGFTGIIYVFMVISAVSVFTSDMTTGGGQLFLSQPVSRKTYVLAWMLVCLVTPTFIFLTSLVVPALIIEPRLLEAIGFRDIALMVLEAFEVGGLLFLLALLVKRRGVVLVLGVVLYFIVPWVIFLALTFLAFVLSFAARAPGWLATIAKVYATLYPSKSGILSTALRVKLEDAPLYSVFLSGLYILSSILYAHRRLEVR